MIDKMVFLQTVLSATAISYFDQNNDEIKTNEIKEDKRSKYSNWTFKDFLEKYQPSNVAEKLDKLRKSGVKLSKQQEIDLFLKGIDLTDVLLNLKVKNGDAKLLIMKDGRRWRPPIGLAPYYRDKFSLRRRLFELMKQAIYQARNKMVIMQTMRKKYRNQAVYKMGYLMSKTDRACKTFAMFAYRAFRGCVLARQRITYRLRVYEILSAHERALNLWFNAELLIDLIRKNDEICRLIINDINIPIKKPAFDEKFVD